MANFLDRFWSKVEISDPSACWIWVGGRDAAGYGQFSVITPNGRSTIRSHRFAYEALMGAIPDELVMDHLCEVRECVNPHHLEPVTVRENILRGDTGERERAKTHCPQGHPYSGDNLVIHHGSRECRTCKNIKQRARRELARS